MKKHLFLFAAAAIALASCSSDDTIAENSSVGNQQQKEIAFFPLATPTTRAAITDGVFPTGTSMEVAAYTGGKGELFGHSTFTHSDGTIWTGSKYWPLSPCFVNFLAYANLTTGSATWGTSSNDASKVVLVMADNSSTQNDLIYAVGQGQVEQSGNALSFPANVPMVFKHAQALFTFNLKAADDASQAITISSITLVNAHFSGTYTIDNSANYNATTSISPSVTGSWTTVGDATASQTINVSGALSSPKTGQIMAVPNGAIAAFDKFIINYQLNSVDYTYEYTPDDKTLAEGKNYVYDITFKLNEIKINASVSEWEDNRTEYVYIPTMAYSTNYTISASAAAQTLIFNVAGLSSASNKYKVIVSGTDADQVNSTTPTANTATALSSTNASVKVDMKASGGAAKTFTITIQERNSGDTEDVGTATVITVNQAAS